MLTSHYQKKVRLLLEQCECDDERGLQDACLPSCLRGQGCLEKKVTFHIVSVCDEKTGDVRLVPVYNNSRRTSHTSHLRYTSL